MAKGTSNYRAPELLSEQPTFTNKVDIWALGCVLYELSTFSVAFRGDWAVRDYMSDEKPRLQVSIPSLPDFLGHHISENINDLLNTDSNCRPCSANVCSMFLSYCLFLDLPFAQNLVDLRQYPSYTEWKELVESHPSERQLLYKLAGLYDEKGEKLAAIGIRDVLDPNKAMTTYMTAIKMNSNVLSGWENLAEVCIETRDYNGALCSYIEAVKNSPMSFWMWHSLCQVYFMQDDMDGAIAACKEGISKYPDSPSPVLALTNVYAAKGDYGAAMETYMQLFMDRHDMSSLRDILLLAFTEPRDEFVTLRYNGNQATKNLLKR